MYKKEMNTKKRININNSYEGETLEKKIQRIVNNKEPISDGAPIIYTERKDGVKPEHDIRTDRFEVAIEAMDHVNKSIKAKREAKAGGDLGKKAKEGMEKEGDTGGEPIQGTEPKK